MRARLGTAAHFCEAAIMLHLLTAFGGGGQVTEMLSREEYGGLMVCAAIHTSKVLAIHTSKILHTPHSKGSFE